MSKAITETIKKRLQLVAVWIDNKPFVLGDYQELETDWLSKLNESVQEAYRLRLYEIPPKLQFKMMEHGMGGIYLSKLDSFLVGMYEILKNNHYAIEVVLQVYLDCYDETELEWLFNGIKDGAMKLHERFFEIYTIESLKQTKDFSGFKDVLDYVLFINMGKTNKRRLM